MTRAKHPEDLIARNAFFATGALLPALDAESDAPENWYARDIGTDLDRLRSAGCSLVRIHVSWRLTEPQVGRYDDDVLARLDDVLASLLERKLKAIVCMFADDRHAELSNVTWAGRRDPRTDPYLLERERAFVSHVTARLQANKAVFAWELGSEAFFSGFGDAETCAEWTGALRDAIRERDARRPIGFGACTETLAHATGIDTRVAAATCDYGLAHVTAGYRAQLAAGPLAERAGTYLPAFLVHLARHQGPVLLDEVGPHDQSSSVADEARALRLAAWTTLANRGAGVLVSRVRDLRTDRREPYFVDPYQALVGVLDEDGEPKPAYRELGAFMEQVSALDVAAHHLVAEKTAVVVSAERYEPLPSLGPVYAARDAFQAFCAAKRAHLPVTVCTPSDGLDGYRMLVLPSIGALSDAFAEQLGTFVRQGGTVVASSGGPVPPSLLRDVFGLETLGDGGPRSTLSVRVAQPGVLGELESFDAALPLPSFSLLAPITATVLVTDPSGSPLVTSNSLGTGRALFVAAPLERAVAQYDPELVPFAATELLKEIYAASARMAGCPPPIECDAPDIETALFAGDGSDVVVLINHGRARTTAHLRSSRDVGSVSGLGEGAATSVGGREFSVTVPGHGAVALHLHS